MSNIDGVGQHAQNLFAMFAGERIADTAGHHPARMNALATKHLDYLLSDLAQTHAIFSQGRIGSRHSDQVALSWWSIHAEEQIGRREVEKTECVGLSNLGQVDDATQLYCRWRNAHRHEHVAGFGRCDEMADRTNAANACHQRRHFVKWPALDEFLEASQLRDVKKSILDFACIIEVNGDLGMTFYACHWIDDDFLAHDYSSSTKSGEVA